MPKSKDEYNKMFYELEEIKGKAESLMGRVRPYTSMESEHEATDEGEDMSYDDKPGDINDPDPAKKKKVALIIGLMKKKREKEKKE